MNNLRTARLLMAATILLVIAFQVYWLNKLFHEEQSNFKKTADIVFRESMYRLQAERFTRDSVMFKGAATGDNLFMTDIISTVRKNLGDDTGTPQRKMMITLKTGHSDVDEEALQGFKRDTVLYVNTQPGVLPPAHISRFLDSNKILTDTIPLKKIDSLYRVLLAREGIAFHFTIRQSSHLKNDSAGFSFVTKMIPVGFMSPVFYQAVFTDPYWYILKKIAWHLVLSLLLVSITILSFVFIYRSLLAQQRLTAIKNDFIGNITHELKTPISTVSVAIEAMRNFDVLQDPARTSEYLGIAGQELNRLTLLVDKVLRLSMFEKQEVDLQYANFNLLQLVEEVTDTMQLQFQKWGAEVKLHSEGDDFTVVADRMHLTSVIYNLLDNALKYSKGRPQIDISIRAKEQQLRLEVKDNGIGIPASYRGRVFEKFFRVPRGDRHNIKGYGLGLSYVAHIIAQHKGTVSVLSEDGQGTTFIIQLPKQHGG